MNKVQKAFDKHGADFGVTGNWNPSKADEIIEAISNHVHSPNTQRIQGTYRWNIPGYHYYDPTTGLWTFTDLDGNFVTGWNIHNSPQQLNDLLTKGNVW